MTTTIQDLRDASGKTIITQSGEDLDVDFEFTDTRGAAVAKAAILTLTATLFDETTNTLINGRSNQAVIDVNGGTVTSGGVLTLRLGPSDNIIVGGVDVGDTERHVLRVTWTWSDGVQVRTGIRQVGVLVERLA